jgi:hypothetical protein
MFNSHNSETTGRFAIARKKVREIVKSMVGKKSLVLETGIERQ